MGEVIDAACEHFGLAGEEGGRSYRINLVFLVRGQPHCCLIISDLANRLVMMSLGPFGRVPFLISFC